VSKDQKPTDSPMSPAPPMGAPPMPPTGQGPVIPYAEFKLQTKKYYWLGTLPGAPVQAVSTSHCRFPGFTADRQTNIQDGKAQMVERMGRLGAFSDEEVEQIKRELGYEFIATKAGKPIIVEDEMGVRKEFKHTLGRVWTQKDASGTPIANQRQEPWMEGSKPLAAFVYMVPLDTTDLNVAMSKWPLLQSFVNVEKIVEGEGLVWANLDQFKMDRMPQPVGRPAEGAKKTA
jgi:hypothetical protein